MKDTSDLRAWYREDLRQLIAALGYLNLKENGLYRDGFADCLYAMCLMLGIDPMTIGDIEDHER